MALFDLVAIDNFNFARSIQRSAVSPEAIATVRSLDEKSEMEPWLQGILHDTNRTPHAPSEVVDMIARRGIELKCHIPISETLHVHVPFFRDVDETSHTPFKIFFESNRFQSLTSTRWLAPTPLIAVPTLAGSC